MEKVFQSIMIFIPFIIYLYLFNIYAPSHRIKQAKWMNQDITHRGYFTQDQHIPENSLLAFKKAMDLGYGSELDVQCTQDGVVMVFHDDTLERACQISGLLEAKNYHEIKDLKLFASEEKIPSLQEVLSLIQGKVPLMIEIKHTDRIKMTVSQVKAVLKDYHGPYSICSFNPLIVQEVKRQMPLVLRGQLMENALHKKNHSLIQRLILHYALMNGLNRPDFLSIHHQQINITYRLHRVMGGFGVMWPVQNPKQAAQAKKHANLIIFEHFQP